MRKSIIVALCIFATQILNAQDTIFPLIFKIEGARVKNVTSDVTFKPGKPVEFSGVFINYFVIEEINGKLSFSWAILKDGFVKKVIAPRSPASKPNKVSFGYGIVLNHDDSILHQKLVIIQISSTLRWNMEITTIQGLETISVYYSKKSPNFECNDEWIPFIMHNQEG